MTWDRVTANVPLLLDDSTQRFIYGPDGNPIEQITGTTPTWLFADQLGSTTMATGATGAVTGTWTYDPYGTVTTHTGTATTPLLYASQYQDTESGLLYLRARYLDPATAQFLTRDPITAETRDTYGYVGGDPLQRVDPTGLDWIQDAGDWAAAFGDTVTFGGTQWVREQLGVDDAVNKCSLFYEWGGNGGTVAQVGLLAVGGVAATGWVGAASAGRVGLWAQSNRFLGTSSRLFGNKSLGSRPGLLNPVGKGPWRLGWSVNSRIEPARVGFRLKSPWLDDYKWIFFGSTFPL